MVSGEIPAEGILPPPEDGIRRLAQHLVHRERSQVRRAIITGTITGGIALFCMTIGLQDPTSEIMKEYGEEMTSMARWATGIKDITIDPHLIQLWFVRACGIFTVASGIRFYNAYENYRDLRGLQRDLKDWLL